VANEYWRDKDKVNWENSPDAYWNPITLKKEVPLAFGVEFTRTREVYDTASATIYAHTWEEADSIAEKAAQEYDVGYDGEYLLGADIDTDDDYIGHEDEWYAEVGVDHEKIEKDRESAKADPELCKIENEHLWEVPYAALRS
tara:strand:- start:1128 stop:1553 length:426 start_codon:yes stop_codon:yes gene_type:complete